MWSLIVSRVSACLSVCLLVCLSACRFCLEAGPLWGLEAGPSLWACKLGPLWGLEAKGPNPSLEP